MCITSRSDARRPRRLASVQHCDSARRRACFVSEIRCCERMDDPDIIWKMLRSPSVRVPLAGTLILVFAVSVSYASVCSTLCAAGICPNELQHSSDPDGCDQMPMGHSHSPQNHATHHHDCVMHHHPSTNIVKAGNAPDFQLARQSHRGANDLLSGSAQLFTVNPTSLSPSGLAPPLLLSSPVNSRIAVLRI